MDGNTKEKIREIMRKGNEIMQQIGIADKNLRKRFTPEELKHIEAVEKTYSGAEISAHMEQVFDWYLALDYEESEEERYAYYREMLNMTLK